MFALHEMHGGNNRLVRRTFPYIRCRLIRLTPQLVLLHFLQVNEPDL